MWRRWTLKLNIFVDNSFPIGPTIIVRIFLESSSIVKDNAAVIWKGKLKCSCLSDKLTSPLHDNVSGLPCVHRGLALLLVKEGRGCLDVWALRAAQWNWDWYRFGSRRGGEGLPAACVGLRAVQGSQCPLPGRLGTCTDFARGGERGCLPRGESWWVTDFKHRIIVE